MIANLTLALATPLADLRGYWLEMRCCGGPKCSPLWFHAALRPDWLLSDLALDHTCPSCGTMPALALLRQAKDGMPIASRRMEIVGPFADE